MWVFGRHGFLIGERNTLDTTEVLVFEPSLSLEVGVEESDGTVAVTTDEVLLLSRVNGHHLVNLNELVWVHFWDQGNNFDQPLLVLLSNTLDDQ